MQDDNKLTEEDEKSAKRDENEKTIELLLARKVGRFIFYCIQVLQ